MFGLSVTEILLIVGAGVLLFGARRLPVVGKSLGQAITSFLREVRSESREESPKLPEERSPGDAPRPPPPSA
jgi:sec-independent protein translocase protein TatA